MGIPPHQMQGASEVKDASSFILRQLLTDFREHQREANDLHHGYQGMMAPSELKRLSLSEGIDEVDYDLAFKALLQSRLIGTGPLEAYDNPPGSSVVVF
jgi:hypothetical protein